MWIILGLILSIIIIVCYLIFRTKENFDGSSLPQVRRLMSYDIRGDIPIPFRQVSPWNNPEVGPIHNRQLNLY